MTRRMAVALFALPFSAIVVVLLLADRAPDQTIGRVGRLWTLGSRIQARLGFDLLDRTDIPFELDTVGHLGLWFAAGLLARALTPMSVRSRALLAALLIVSTMMEVAQGFLTSGRNVELSDAIANGVGVACGVVVVTALVGVWSLATQLGSYLRRLPPLSRRR